MKKLTLICALVIVFAISAVASAEVQSIRVSGEINTYGIYRDDEGIGIYLDADDDNDQFIMSTIGLNFDADLTENVTAHLKLVSQRDWDRSNQGATSFDVGIAEAYITLREMLYEPLTVRIGSQPLYYGRGLLIGSNLQDVEGSIASDEYSLYDGFDAITATLDYAPWTIDIALIKIEENTIDEQDDRGIGMINAGYDFENDYATEIEGYFALDYEGSSAVGIKSNEIYTIGIRGSMAPVENSLIFAEVARQFGDVTVSPIQNTSNATDDGYLSNRSEEDNVEAFAFELGAEYAWIDVLTAPKIGFVYTYLSGEERAQDGDYEGFTANFMRKSDTAIYGWNGRLAGNNATADGDDTPWTTNLKQILISGSFTPLAAMDVEDINLELKYAHFEFDEQPTADSDKEAGDELDINLTYDYTEDLQFGLLTAIFWPGDYYKQTSSAYDTTVYQVVGSCKLTF